MKANANKVRTLKGGKILAGFAGAAADAFTCSRSSRRSWNATPATCRARRSSWPRTGARDRVLRRLEALLVVADREHGFVISGSGELIEPDDGILAIGSGGELRTGSGARAAERLGPVGQGDRAALARDRGRDLRVHQHPDHRAGAVMAEPTRTPDELPPGQPPREEEQMPWLEELPPQEDRGGARPLHRGPGGREESGRDRGAQPLAPRAGARRRSATRSCRTTSS